MSKIRELIAEGFEQYEDLELIANYVFRKTTKNDYFPLLMDEVRNADRHRVRGIERAVFTKRPASSTAERADSAPQRVYAKLEDSVNVAQARATWLEEGLFIPGKGAGVVTWGTATIQDHDERAVYMRKMAAGNIETAIRHEKASALLQEKGATCLNELSEDDLRGLM